MPLEIVDHTENRKYTTNCECIFTYILYILCRIAGNLSAYNDFMLITLIIIIVFYVFIMIMFIIMMMYNYYDYDYANCFRENFNYV